MPARTKSKMSSPTCDSGSHLAAPIQRRDLHSQAIRIAHEEIVAGTALHAFDSGAPDPAPQPFGVEIVNADAEVIDAPRLVTFLQDDQASAWQIKSMVVGSLDLSGWRKAKQISIERLRASNIGNADIHVV